MSASATSPSIRRAFDAAGLHPAVGGLALAVVATAVFLAQEFLLGRLPLSGSPPEQRDLLYNLQVTLAHIVSCATFLGATAAAQTAVVRCVERLSPLLSASQAERIASRSRADRAWVTAMSVVGVASSVAVAFGSPGTVSYDPGTWSPENAWHRVLGIGMGFWLARLLSGIVVDSQRISEAAAGIRDLDLLDPAALAPIGRYGLVNALLVLAAAAALGLFLIDPVYLTLFAPLFLTSAASGVAALLLPAWGARRCIREQKQRELQWCRERLREARAALHAGRPSEPPPGELIAWEARIERVREWPFDASALQRFGLYLLIPVLSWSGAAVVERWVDALLDRAG